MIKYNLVMCYYDKILVNMAAYDNSAINSIKYNKM